MKEIFWPFDNSKWDNALSPREVLEAHGDMTLLEYVEFLDSLSIGREKTIKMTHEQIVAEHLDYIGPLTQKAAALLYDNWRLSPTIARLKKTLSKEGSYCIHTELLPTRRSGKYARYFLIDIKSNDGDKNCVTFA